MADRIYHVGFQKQANCTIYEYVYHCTAKNATEAKAKAKAAWEQKHKNHMFHLEAFREDVKSIDELSVSDDTGKEITGADAYERFICTYWRIWKTKPGTFWYWATH